MCIVQMSIVIHYTRTCSSFQLKMLLYEGIGLDYYQIILNIIWMKTVALDLFAVVARTI